MKHIWQPLETREDGRPGRSVSTPVLLPGLLRLTGADLA